MFQKGHKKIGGKTKGSHNQSTKTAREIISKAVMGELDTIQDYLKQLKAEEKHDQYIKLLNTLLPYVAPKMKESDEKGNSSTAPTINLILDSNGAEVIRKANDGLVAVNNQPD